MTASQKTGPNRKNQPFLGLGKGSVVVHLQSFFALPDFELRNASSP
jgi:hypothetical protein